MDIDGLIIRRATQDDKSSVLAINDNVYDGLDYLPAYFDNFMTSPNVKAYVGVIDSEVVAFSIAFLVDDGQTVISRAGRVSEKYSGRKVYSRLQRHLLEQSGAAENRFTTANTNPAVNTESFKSENELVSSRSMIRLDFQLNDIDLETFKDDTHRNQVKIATRDDLQKFMTSRDLATYLFPDDVIIIEWVPYRLFSSNIPLMGLSAMSNMCSNVKDDRSDSPGLFSILTLFRTSINSLTGNLDIYGSDVSSIDKHLAKQLSFVKTYAYKKASILVFFNQDIDISVVENCFIDFGLRKFDWLYSSSGVPITKQLAYRKQIKK